jgi:hypothetical protein
MTDDRSLERAARSWLENGPAQAPDRAVEAALLRIQTTPQERDLRIPWRFPKMNTPARIAAAAVIGVLAIGGALYAFGPGGSIGGPGLTPQPKSSPSPIALVEGLLAPGTYLTTPFDDSAGSLGVCEYATQTGCTESPADDTIRISFTVPAGWAGTPVDLAKSVWLDGQHAAPTSGAWLDFERGGWLYADPCGGARTPTITVGPSVADLADALESHPKLDVTPPVDVTLAGYAGKYMDLQVPDDISACPDSYYAWEPGAYAQGPGHRWHLWILDVDGTRVVIRSMDFAGTTTQRQTELRAIVESIRIEP